LHSQLPLRALTHPIAESPDVAVLMIDTPAWEGDRFLALACWYDVSEKPHTEIYKARERGIIGLWRE